MKGNGKLLITVLLFGLLFSLSFSILISPSSMVLAEEEYGEESDEYYDDGDYEDEYYDDGDYLDEDYDESEEDYFDYPPVNIDIWPDIQYVLEIDSSILVEGAIHRQYYGKHMVRMETGIGDNRNFVIYKFDREGVEEIISLPGQEQYMVMNSSYEEFFEEDETLLALFYRVLPGEELAMPGFEMLCKRDYQDRKVEEWAATDNSEGEPVTINLLVDSELRQILQMTLDGEIVYKVTGILIKELPAELFVPPADYQPVYY